jgi:hypothetical protein
MGVEGAAAAIAPPALTLWLGHRIDISVAHESIVDFVFRCTYQVTIRPLQLCESFLECSL